MIGPDHLAGPTNNGSWGGASSGTGIGTVVGATIGGVLGGPIGFMVGGTLGGLAGGLWGSEEGVKSGDSFVGGAGRGVVPGVVGGLAGGTIGGAIGWGLSKIGGEAVEPAPQNTAILRNGYYEINGFRFSQAYYGRLWASGRSAPGFRAEQILQGAMGPIQPDPEGMPGFFRYV